MNLISENLIENIFNYGWVLNLPPCYGNVGKKKKLKILAPSYSCSRALWLYRHGPANYVRFCTKIVKTVRLFVLRFE